MSSIFDDIYNKNLNLNFKNLNQSSYKPKIEIKSLDPKNLELETLNSLFENLYNSNKITEVPKYTEEQISIIDEKINRNREEAELLRNELSEIKDSLLEEYENRSYVLSIKKSTSLKKAANNVFGGNKKEITYKDYVTLLEMKKQIIFNESNSLFEEEDA